MAADRDAQTETASIEANFAAVRQTMAEAAAAVERRADSVTLVAVSKVQPEARVDAALQVGHRTFGENYVQEAQERWRPRRPRYPDLDLHLVGPLQSNKAGEAVALFDLIQTLDRDKLAAALSKEMAKQGRRVPCLIQVNTGEEPQKAGLAPLEVEAFLHRARETHGLEVRGLMAIPPAAEPPAPHFALLAELARKLDLPIVSMGMSEDYPTAIRLGATHVRVGTALFGARPERKR